MRRRTSCIAVLAIASCASPRAPDSLRSSSEPRPAGANAAAQSVHSAADDDGGAGDAGALARYAARFLRESGELGQPLRLYIAHDQPAPRGFVDLAKRRHLPRSLGRARMFAYNFADPFYGDCGEQAVLPDGTLCSSAVYPGQPLSDEETRQAAAILRSAPSSWRGRPDIRCFEPHHSVVFFDDHDVPVAEISVCFECGNMKLFPGPGREAGMTDDEGLFFAGLCRAHGLGACPPPGAKEIPDFPESPGPSMTEDEAYTQERAFHIHHALSLQIDVPLDRRIDRLSGRDLNLFVAWLATVAHAAEPALQCGERFIMCSEGEDWDQHPHCDATVGDLQACARSRLEPLCGPDAPECARSDACRWGVFKTTRPAKMGTK